MMSYRGRRVAPQGKGCAEPFDTVTVEVRQIEVIPVVVTEPTVSRRRPAPQLPTPPSMKTCGTLSHPPFDVRATGFGLGGSPGRAEPGEDLIRAGDQRDPDDPRHENRAKAVPVALPPPSRQVPDRPAEALRKTSSTVWGPGSRLDARRPGRYLVPGWPPSVSASTVFLAGRSAMRRSIRRAGAGFTRI